MHIFVTLSTGRKVELDVEPNWTIRGIKELIQAESGISIEQIRLLHQGMLLENESTVESHNLTENCNITVVVSLNAGF